MGDLSNYKNNRKYIISYKKYFGGYAGYSGHSMVFNSYFWHP
jgi:monoamine oxidase